ncbi:MAG: hypothetical protein EZS28_042341 [Streblomastix strix]|uniref:Uncharacterized protein n=1 Tax=Streblomastix strix TaxID=222440 RepID=A0A5J4TWA4_9EUKA|nr:MAG: hypothetical protein EZS28_042341 [Streblomastix strix]
MRLRQGKWFRKFVLRHQNQLKLRQQIELIRSYITELTITFNCIIISSFLEYSKFEHSEQEEKFHTIAVAEEEEEHPQRFLRNQINLIQLSSLKSIAKQAAGHKKINIPSFPSNIPIYSHVLISSNYALHPLISPRYSINIKSNRKNNNNNNEAESKGSSLARGVQCDIRDSKGQKIQRINIVHIDNIQDKTGYSKIDKEQQQSKDESNPPGSAEKQTRVLFDMSKMSERLEKIDREREQKQQKIKSSKDRSALPGQSNQTHAISSSIKSHPKATATAQYQQRHKNLNATTTTNDKQHSPSNGPTQHPTRQPYGQQYSKAQGPDASTPKAQKTKK